MRLMLIVVTVAVAMLLDLRVSQATQMPWCAGTSRLRYRQGRTSRQDERHPWPRLRISFMCGMEPLSNETVAVPAMVLLHPKEVPQCLTGTVSKICWRFCTGTLQRRLTRSHSIVGALSTAICQWDSKFTVWATRVSSLPWWKVLAELKKFSMSTTTNTPTPRCVLCCLRWGVPVRRYSCLSVSRPLWDRRFSVTRKSRSRYARQGDLSLIVRHCWR